MTVNDFIDSVASGNASEAKETLNDILSARAFEALEAKKIDLAQTLFVNRKESDNIETA